MPKKQPRNSFYYYMLDFKEEQRKKGINYNNLQEVATAAGPSWKDSPPSVRQHYEALSKKNKACGDTAKYTSQGQTIEEVKMRDNYIVDAEDSEQKDIKNSIVARSHSILYEQFYVFDVNYYCVAGNVYVICEFAILRFNLMEGIKDQYYGMVTPHIPLGYMSDVKASCKELGLDLPDGTGPSTNYIQILSTINDYLRQGQANSPGPLPPLFTMPDKVPAVKNFIQQMCARADEDDALFRVYKINTLFFELINNIKKNESEGFPKQTLALAQLKKDTFQYHTGLGCKHHEESDLGKEKFVQCALSRCKRWSYTILDYCCPVAGIEMKTGQHLPQNLDVNAITIIKEQKIEEQRKKVPLPNAVMPAVGWGNHSFGNQSFDSLPGQNDEDAWPSLPGRSSNLLRATATRQAESMSVMFASTARALPALSEQPMAVGRGRGSRTQLNNLMTNLKIGEEPKK